MNNLLNVSLAACPFCGSDLARLREIPAVPLSRYVVICYGCSARGPGKDAPELAINGWNRRDTQSEVGDE